MDKRTEQEKMNNIHSGWEFYKEQNPNASISPEFDQMIESRMMEANGFETLKEPTESEKVQLQAEMIAESLSHNLGYIESNAKLMAQQHPVSTGKYINKFRVYAGMAAIIGGVSLAGVGTFAMVKTPIGGVVKDLVTTPIKKIIEIDNQKLEDEYEEMSSEVEELTGMTPEEIMEKGRNIH